MTSNINIYQNLTGFIANSSGSAYFQLYRIDVKKDLDISTLLSIGGIRPNSLAYRVIDGMGLVRKLSKAKLSDYLDVFSFMNKETPVPDSFVKNCYYIPYLEQLYDKEEEELDDFPDLYCIINYLKDEEAKRRNIIDDEDQYKYVDPYYDDSNFKARMKNEKKYKNFLNTLDKYSKDDLKKFKQKILDFSNINIEQKDYFFEWIGSRMGEEGENFDSFLYYEFIHLLKFGISRNVRNKNASNTITMKFINTIWWEP